LLTITSQLIFVMIGHDKLVQALKVSLSSVFLFLVSFFKEDKSWIGIGLNGNKWKKEKNGWMDGWDNEWKLDEQQIDSLLNKWMNEWSKERRKEGEKEGRR